MAFGFLASRAHSRGLRHGVLAGGFLLTMAACGGKVADTIPPYTLDPHLGPPDPPPSVSATVLSPDPSCEFYGACEDATADDASANEVMANDAGTNDAGTNDAAADSPDDAH